MDEYLQKLDIFYDQKMKYLSNKEKYLRCNGCEDRKAFTEGKEKLILSCGSEKGGCGPQIIIKLPKYIKILWINDCVAPIVISIAI